MNIVGLNFFHADTSAVLVQDNKVVAAAEEERFSRIKHFSGFPVQSLDFCLKKGNIRLNDVDYISINTNPYYNLHSKISYAATNFKNILSYVSRLGRIRKKTNINEFLYRYFGNTIPIKIKFVPHHFAHASASIFSSNISEGLSISFDAAGDFSTIEVYDVNKGEFKKISSTKFPHSIGILYQALTQYLGFKDYGDEYKVMGLAAYGRPIYVEQLKKVYSIKKGQFNLKLKYFTHHKIGFDFNFPNGYPDFDNLFSSEMVNLLGPTRKKNEEINQRHKDIASSLQRIFEEIFYEIISFFQKEKNYKNLFLSGGCAFNALNNKFVGDKNNFENISIFPNSGDAGGALGAALYTNFKYNKNYKFTGHPSIYLGPEEENNKILKNIRYYFDCKKKEFEHTEINDDLDLLKTVASYLNQGSVIAWHQGRMEFGPRALGNRSILANPSLPEIKNIINKKIKTRESFRPFAPSVLSEYAEDYFILKKNLDYRFMNVICDTKSNIRKSIPGVVNIDNTSRPQIVFKEINDLYYNLINEFFKLSKIPILLNTSLNIQEPICHSSADTIECFLRSEIDILVIGNHLVKRIK